MLRKNVELVLSQIGPSDKVLDIGGWAIPFNRANCVVDIMPYETRAIWGSSGPKQEYFSKDTWIVQDISSKKPLPFKDKEIDFVVCSHVLEDIRDPIHVCSEMVRIGKRGYIEVPKRAQESIMDLVGKHYTGQWHHRWLVEIEGQQITFRFKTPLIHQSWRYHLPKSYARTMTSEEGASFMFWEGEFEFREAIQISGTLLAQELEDFVKATNAYPSWRYWFDDAKRKVKAGALRAIGKSRGPGPDADFWNRLPEISSR